jgi:hypothetical protein
MVKILKEFWRVFWGRAAISIVEAERVQVKAMLRLNRVLDYYQALIIEI